VEELEENVGQFFIEIQYSSIFLLSSSLSVKLLLKHTRKHHNVLEKEKPLSL
jgi:hypothetical protein